MRNIRIKWEQFDLVCKKLAIEIGEHPNFVPGHSCLYGVAKGGFFPAALIAYKMNLESCFLREYYTDSYCHAHSFIIDDVYDGGSTYKRIKKDNPLAIFVVAYSKKIVSPKGMLVGRRILTESYIKLPWEI